MLEVVVKFICSFIGSVAGALMIKNITGEKLKINFKNVILLIILAIITTVQFKTTYTIAITLLSYISTIFIYKLMFKISFKKSVLASGLMMIIILVIDSVLSFIIVNFVTIYNMRMYSSTLILTNITIYGAGIGLSFLKTQSHLP